MVSVALARMGTVTLVSPLELVRTKLLAQHVSRPRTGYLCPNCSGSGWLALAVTGEELAEWAKTKRTDICGRQLFGWWHLKNGGCHPYPTLRCGEDTATNVTGSNGCYENPASENPG